MSLADSINDIIGKPFNAETFHCWTLVEELLPEAPKLDVTATSIIKSIKHFRDEMPEIGLIEVDTYENGDIIVLGKNGVYMHAGVYYDGGLVHVDHYGARYQPMKDIDKVYTMKQGLRSRPL